MSSGNEETISKAAAVSGGFFDPFVTENENCGNNVGSSITTVRNSGGNRNPNMYFCFNDDSVQVFRNNNKDNDNDILKNEKATTASVLQVSLEDLNRLTLVKQVKHVLSCAYKGNPVLIIVASSSHEKEEKNGHNAIFWFNVVSESLKLVALDEPLVGVICSLNIMHVPMEVPLSSGEELKKHTKVLRHILALGMQDGSIRVIMLEYPIQGDVVRTTSTTVKASELDGAPVTSVELILPNIHTTDSRKSQDRVYLNHALLIAGTIRGLLIHLKICSLDTIHVKRPNRLKRHTAYEEGAITHITALRDFNNETRCILAVGQDSSLDVGRNTTQNCDKQACVNIIELYANNKKKWLFIIRPNKLNEMCEITSMRLIPATVGYSVIIAFRAISGNASEIVRHTISSSHDGQLDLEVTIPGSERLLDAYPFKDTCLALTQRRLVQNPNDSNVSWNDRLLLFDSCGNVEITDKITGSKGGFSNMGSLTVATTNQYSRGSSVESQSQATTDYDSTASAVSVELGDTQGSQSGFNTQDMLPRDDAGDIAALEQQLDYVQEVTNAAPDEILTGDEHLSQETVLGESFQQVVEQGMITTEATHVDERQQTAICEIPTVTETPQSETHGADSGPYNEMAIDMEEQDELMEDEEGTIASAKDESQGGLLENDTTEGEFVDEALIYHQSETHLMEVENDKAITTSKYPDYEAELQIVPSITAEPTSDTSISSEDEERCPRMTEKRRGDVDASPDTSGTEESEPRAICEQQLSDLEQDGSELALEEDKSDSKIEPESQSVVPAALNDRFPMPLVEEQAALSLPHSLPFSAHFIQKAPSPPSLPQPQQKLLPCQQKQEPHTSPSHTLTSADNSTVWSTFATTTPSSSTTSSSKMLPAFDYDSTSPSPLRLSDEDHRSLSSPYVHVPMPIQEETETSSQRQPDYDDSYNDYQNDDDYYDKSIVPVYSPTMTQQKQQQQQLPIRRHEAVNEQLFIDLILQELLGHEYNKNYPNLSDKFSLLLARPADKQQPNYQAHTFARYYSSLRDSGDAVTSTSLIHISEADANLVTAYWLFDRCEYTRALTYLQSEKCSSSSYDFKIMKTLEKGLGVQKAHRCLEEIEATRGTDTAIFQPNSWVHFLRDISLESVFKYIKSTPRDMDIRNNLLVTVCKDLFQGSTVPSTQEIRDLAVFDHNEEQRQQLFSFAKSMETVASKTLLMYLHLKTNQRTQFGEAVILNRAIQATKPEAGLLVTDEEALYRRCQELEDLVYSHEPKNARHFLPEWYFFPPGQAKPPYDKLFRENRTKVGSMLMIDAMARKMAEATGSNKRPHREDDEEDGQEREDDCKKARRM